MALFTGGYFCLKWELAILITLYGARLCIKLWRGKEGEMKKITRMSLFWIGVVVAAFLASSACFILIAGYVWATNKISVFLDKLCIIWDLHIPNAFLDMLPHSIVGSFILTLIAILFYFLFFSQTFPDPEE